MKAALASLPKGLSTVINATNEWFGTGVGKIVFYQVLLESEGLVTFCTFPLLVNFVDFHMTFEAVLGLEFPIAADNITLEQFVDLGHHFV